MLGMSSSSKPGSKRFSKRSSAYRLLEYAPGGGCGVKLPAPDAPTTAVALSSSPSETDPELAFRDPLGDPIPDDRCERRRAGKWFTTPPSPPASNEWLSDDTRMEPPRSHSSSPPPSRERRLGPKSSPLLLLLSLPRGDSAGSAPVESREPLDRGDAPPTVCARGWALACVLLAPPGVFGLAPNVTDLLPDAPPLGLTLRWPPRSPSAATSSSHSRDPCDISPPGLPPGDETFGLASTWGKSIAPGPPPPLLSTEFRLFSLSMNPLDRPCPCAAK